MKKESTSAKAPADKQTKDESKKDRKPLRQKGGMYFHCGAIIGRKNVFVTDQYIDLLVNAFKATELKKDVKNLAFVVMPNYFYWIFRLSENKDNPVEIYGELKGDVAKAILETLQEESKGEAHQLADLFKDNERVGRTTAERLIWTFEEYGKQFETSKRYKVWTPKTEIRLIDTDEILQQKLTVIKKAPTLERWQMAKKSEDYPYLYIADELQEIDTNKLKIADFLPIINIESSQVTA
ncbi:hypothetical protein HN858_01415 [Candidatus Falkowbacteria bacterium]|jgi:REP element-mobilizing transposase RayT|nr:hypothetical protein [Candidatus Falkowbacteria bacterium]MBT5503147.1 hypothetical protein [Candidatus Falkowbacteria bacterium]MBT6574535.1 hypothetical protein [Candidatus Falkowbacteria bacterium]MBT7348312.1 hypothetical protein [Candidatus Falkowbacteria bacterium]MBT7500888.1 hypothetical protein [Candidatus Falkowbacteria bacterium]